MAAIDQIPWRERLSTLASAVIVSGMMACFAFTIVQTGQRLFGDWEGTYLVAVAFLVSLESMVTHSSRKGLMLFSSEWLIYRFSEWILLLIFLKLVLYLVHGFDQLWIDIPSWGRNFGQQFFTNEYIGLLLVSFLVWLLSSLFAFDLTQLGDDRDYYGPVLPDTLRSRSQVRQRIADLILMIGAVMIFLTALLRIEWQSRWLKGQPPQGGFYNILVYFLLGLVLLSLTQFSLLRMRWRDEGIPFSREIASRWAFYSFLFLLGLVILASLLPTHYSIGLLTLGGYLLYIVMSLLRLLWFILLLPLFLLASLVALLLQTSQPEKPELGNLNPPPLPASPASGAPVPWVEALKSAVFWIVFIAVILFSIRYLLQENEELAGRLRRAALVQWLGGVWSRLSSWFNRLNKRVGVAVANGLRRLRGSAGMNTPAGAWRFINVRGLSPRQQVMFYYEALLRRGRERGLPRHPSQTPYEYSGLLKVKIPQQDGSNTKEDLASLTDRFVEARYSRHEITPAHASLARQAWEQIRRTLKRLEN